MYRIFVISQNLGTDTGQIERYEERWNSSAFYNRQIATKTSKACQVKAKTIHKGGLEDIFRRPHTTA